MRKRTALTLKSFGYLSSVVSVLLIGAVAWNETAGSPRLQMCLAAGMIASIIGVVLRWISYWCEEEAK